MKSLAEFHSWLREEQEGPTKFSAEYAKTLNTRPAIADYLHKTLGQPVANGMFRRIWEIDDDTIIKFGDSEQNGNEYEHSKCLGPRFAVKVLDHHPQFHWIIEEHLMVLGTRELLTRLSKLVGKELGSSREIMNFFSASAKSMQNGLKFAAPEWKTEFETLYSKNEWFHNLMDGLKNCDVIAEDFHDENWGLRLETGELVLLDLGF